MSDDRDDIAKDELARLKAALSSTPPPEPSADARQAALQAALRAFDEKNSVSAQGSGAEERPKARQLSLSFLGRLLMAMKPRNLRPVLLGGVSLAVLALAVVVTSKTDYWRDGGEIVALNETKEEAPKPANGAETERADAKQDASESDDRLARAADGDLASPEPAPEQPAGPADIVIAGEVIQDSEKDGMFARPAKPQLATGAGGRAEDAEMEIAATEAPAEVRRQASQIMKRSQAQKQSEGRSRVAAAPGVFMDGYASSQQIGGVVGAADEPAPVIYQDQGRDKFEETEPNPVKRVAEDPVSTFSVDVDTASYSFMRKALMNGVLPQKNAVRIEELVNYFPYDYEAPESRETPFKANVAVLDTPWNQGTKLMRIGIRGYALEPEEKPRSNLVFLIDTSGSMNAPDKLPLLINAFRLLVDKLEPEDTVAIVAYAGSAGTVLEPTKASEKATILSALERLSAGGSTAGAEGVRQAYRLAEQSFDKDGVNRVILATDGDFNVGITDPEELKSFVERKRDTGVYLSVMGFGRGNYNDALMQTLAQNGNGQAAYIDTLSEARKTLVEEAGSTLFPIAKDVKIQIEFNPAMVSEYRLIGYETRMLKREDFNNDKIDAGEIGSGHTVTALYEITPTGSPAELVDGLRYQPAAAEPTAPQVDDGKPMDQELAFLKIRYKQPDSDTSRLIETPVTDAMTVEPGSDAEREARFAAAVAGFGQLLKGGRHTGTWSYDDAAKLADSALGPDPFGYRREFATLVRLAKSAAALERQQ